MKAIHFKGQKTPLLSISPQELRAIADALRIRAFQRYERGEITVYGYKSACKQAAKYRELTQ